MLFNSLSFALFFPAVVLMYLVIPGRFRTAWLLFASYVFYMSANPKYALLLLFSTVVTYVGGLLIGRGEGKKRKLFVGLTFVAGLSVLVLFKYFDFFLGNLNMLLGAVGLQTLSKPFSFLLPVGISFYTFQSLGYIVDVYRGDTEPEKNFIRYALFVSFFPVLLSGTSGDREIFFARYARFRKRSSGIMKGLPEVSRFCYGGFFRKW